MRSAYSVLGVHGNAKPGDIEMAFRLILSTFTRERIAADDGAAEKLNEVMDAYKVLRDPAMRAAHDRRLAQAVTTEPVSSWVEIRYPEQKKSRMPRLIVLLALLLVAVLAGGFLLERLRARNMADLAAAHAAEKQAHQAVAEALQQRARAEQTRRDGMAMANKRHVAAHPSHGQQVALEGR